MNGLRRLSANDTCVRLRRGMQERQHWRSRKQQSTGLHAER
jgi:hypothetical protein